jgi:hypothetical protein
MINRIEKIKAEDLLRAGETYFSESTFMQVAVG